MLQVGSPTIEELYRQHGPMVRQALRRLGVAEATLDDATQDVFVVLHRRMADFDRQRSLTNWLWGIAKGVASTYRRSEQRRARLHAALPRPSHDRRELPDEAIARTEAGQMLERFLSRLDADKCAVFVMAELRGCSGPEIADALDVNLNTVYARLRKARRHFDAAVEQERPQWLAALIPGWWPRGTGVGLGASATAAMMLVAPEVSPPSSSFQRMPYAHIPTQRTSTVVTRAEPDSVARKASEPVLGDIEISSDTQIAVDSAKDEVHTPARASLPSTEETVMIQPKTIRTLGLAAAVTTIATPSLAEAKKPAPSVWQDADDAALVEGEGETRRYIFDDDQLEGDVLNPDGTIIPHRRPPKHPSLIRLRGHFNRELVAFSLDV